MLNRKRSLICAKRYDEPRLVYEFRHRVITVAITHAPIAGGQWQLVVGRKNNKNVTGARQSIHLFIRT